MAIAGDLILSIRCRIAKRPRARSHDERAVIRLRSRGIWPRVITGHRLPSPSGKEEGGERGKPTRRVLISPLGLYLAVPL